MSEGKASLYILCAGTLWGFQPLFVKHFSAAGFSSEQIVFTRVFFSAIFLSLYLAVRRPDLLRIRPADIWCVAGTGIVSIMLMSYCYYRTIASGGIALAALLLYTSPVFVLLFSILFFREHMTRRKLLALGSTVAGCVCITGIYNQSAPAVSWSIIAIGLGAGLFYSLYTVFGKFALRRNASITVTVYTFLFASAGTAFLVPLPETLALLARPDNFLAGCGIALICSLMSFFLYTQGLTGIAPSKAGVLATVEPVVATLTGIFVFHEQATLATFAGMALILSATLLLCKREAKAPEPAPQHADEEAELSHADI